MGQVEQTNLAFLDEWAKSILADPITKIDKQADFFNKKYGIIDVRVSLKNTYGFNGWLQGQNHYESWYASSSGYKKNINSYEDELLYDKEIYDHFEIQGNVLDVGGGAGTLREFLKSDINYISLDPYLHVLSDIPEEKKRVYKCLGEPFNFICGVAEFLPFKSSCFDYVHMRSMLDHVQVPDLALIEANRVLREKGKLLVGLYVEGGKEERRTTFRYIKDCIKECASLIGIKRWKDHHTWHPTFSNLKKLIVSNNFIIDDIFWQPHWNNTVVYILASKKL